MSRRANRGPKVESLEPEELNDSVEVLGKQVWRVVPYAFAILAVSWLGSSVTLVLVLLTSFRSSPLDGQLTTSHPM
jgi:hypothetical protein